MSRPLQRAGSANGVVIAVAALVSVVVMSPAWGSAASPSPIPVVASPDVPAPCATVDPALVADVRTLFAYELTDPHVTHFLNELASASPAAAHESLEAIVQAQDTPEGRHAASEVERLCPTAADLAAEARAQRFVAYDWNLVGLSHAKLRVIGQAVDDAVFALGHASVIAKADMESILLPFAAIASPAPPSSAHCSTPNQESSLARIASLSYPSGAVAAGVSGVVSMKVALSAAGDVTSVSIMHDTTGGGTALVEAAIVAAAGSTYHPELVDCVARPGFYEFRANFDRE